MSVILTAPTVPYKAILSSAKLIKVSKQQLKSLLINMYTFLHRLVLYFMVNIKNIDV